MEGLCSTGLPRLVFVKPGVAHFGLLLWLIFFFFFNKTRLVLQSLSKMIFKNTLCNLLAFSWSIWPPYTASRRLDKICFDGHDRVANIRDKENLEGSHVLHNTKYGSEDLLGLKTKVSTVKGTTEGRVQTVEALADSGASASINQYNMGSSKESEYDCV